MLAATVCPLSKAGFPPEKLLDAALLGFNEAPSTYNHHTVCVCVSKYEQLCGVGAAPTASGSRHAALLCVWVVFFKN